MMVLVMFIGLSLGCKTYVGERDSVSLNGFKAVTGLHCESSALLNALTHQGYGLSEEEIVGAGAVLGFVYQKGQFPFLGGRTLILKENLFSALDIEWSMGDVSDQSKGWEKIYSLLESDTPVVLRVDMRYLPYLYGGKYGSKYMSFGWHMITLVSIDVEKQLAYVTDTAQVGLQEIKLKDLHKARFSRLKVMPPEGEFYWVEKAPEDFSVEWEQVTYESLRKVSSDMGVVYDSESELVGLDGMERLSVEMENLPTDIPSYLLEPVLNFLYGSIETNGTGGAAFRDMYLGFLESKVELNPDFREYVILLKKSVESWDEFSGYLKVMVNDKNSRDYKKLGELADRVYQAEKSFYSSIE